MAYEWAPQIIIGIILLVVGVKLNMNFALANLIRLALILIGITILGFGIFGAFDQFTT